MISIIFSIFFDFSSFDVMYLKIYIKSITTDIIPQNKSIFIIIPEYVLYNITFNTNAIMYTISIGVIILFFSLIFFTFYYFLLFYFWLRRSLAARSVLRRKMAESVRLTSSAMGNDHHTSSSRPVRESRYATGSSTQIWRQTETIRL